MYGINADSITCSEKVGNTKFIKKAGFDCFTFYHYLGTGKNSDMADSLGLSFEHIYVYSLDANLLWKGGDGAVRVLENMKNACNTAVSCSILKVSFNIATDPSIVANDEGFARFDQVIATAKEKGIRLAFRISENTALINAFGERYADNDTVGYCYDNSVSIDGISETVKSRIITTNITDLDGTVEKLDESVPFTAIAYTNAHPYKNMTKEEFLATVLQKLKALG
jgi:hypothetical protein